jgi:tetratricopeptide (TPR) repeat protein
LATSFGFIVVFSSIIILSIYLGRFYVAEVWYGRSFSVPLNQKSTLINRAIELNPQRPIFYSTLAEVFAENARTITANNGDANQALQAVALAIQAAERSTALAPFELTGWEHLAVLYQNAKAFVPEAEGWLLKTLDTMVALEPMNPTFYVQRASAKAAATDSDGAKADLQKAIQLKKDFLPAYIQLTQLRKTLT